MIGIIMRIIGGMTVSMCPVLRNFRKNKPGKDNEIRRWKILYDYLKRS